MSEEIISKTATNNAIECVLSASESYIETLSIQAIDALPGLLELVIRTQLLSAKNPEENRVKSRTCIERSRLTELHQGVGEFLQATESSYSERLKRWVNGKVLVSRGDFNRIEGPTVCKPQWRTRFLRLIGKI